MSIDAVALVRIPEWEPPEELDCRELDDGVLVYLEVPFESEPDALLDALEDAIGDAMYEHDDDRGVFFLPDAADPDEAESYDAVLEAVGDAGVWLSLDPVLPEGVDPAALLENPENLLGQIFEAMGGGSAEDLIRAMREGDQDALKLAQIQMAGAMERTLQQSAPPAEPKDDEKKE